MVIKGVVPPARAAEYASRAHDWLESFDLGYKRDDPKTYLADNLPTSFKGGLYNLYGISQEQFCWDIRQEPQVIAAFAKIWQTDKLLVSFGACNSVLQQKILDGAHGTLSCGIGPSDGANISVPLGFTDNDEQGKAWPHVDQYVAKMILPVTHRKLLRYYVSGRRFVLICTVSKESST